MKGITKKQFNEVIRRLKADESRDVISARVGVQASTIKAIKQAGTYDEYVRRREARNQRRSAARAIHPEPMPTHVQVTKTRTRRKRVPVSTAIKPVAKPQALRGISDDTVSAFMLNHAYNETQALAKRLENRVNDVEAAVHAEQRLTNRSVKRLETSVFELQRESFKRQHKRPWWRFGR